MRFVEQNPHQFGDRHRRVRVVELDGDFFGKRVPIGVAPPETPYQIGERTGHQKIFLHETQSLSLAGGVIRIKHARERFGCERLRHRADEIAVTELLKVEIIGCRSRPKGEAC